MAQEEQHGLTVDTGNQANVADNSGGVNPGNLYGELLRTPLSEYPREAVVAAVNNATAALGVCIVIFAVTSLFYPDRVTNAAGALASVITMVGAIYQMRKHGATKK